MSKRVTNYRLLCIIALLGNVAIWGAALPIVKPSLSYTSPFGFLFWRYALAALLLLPIIFLKRPKNLKLKDIAIMGGIEWIHAGLGLVILYKGLELTSALEASFIGSTSPIFVILGGIYFLKEKQERREWLGLSLSILGTIIVILGGFTGHTNGFSPSVPGNSLIVLYSVSWMAYVLLAKKFFVTYDKLYVASIGALTGFLFYTLLIPFIGPLPSFTTLLSTPPLLLAVLYMATLGTPIAIALFLYGQNKIEASEATLFTYLQPLIYIPLSVLWLGETIITSQLVGLAIIAAGVIIAEARKK
jgi:drug/metabolite transporter (DMT)-like permease